MRLFLGSRSAHDSDPTDASIRKHLDPEVRDRPGHQELLPAHFVLLTRPELDGGQQGLPLVRPPQQG